MRVTGETDATEDSNTAPPTQDELREVLMEKLSATRDPSERKRLIRAFFGVPESEDLGWRLGLFREALPPAEAATEPEAVSPPLRSELTLARCKQCEQAFLKDVIQGSSIAWISAAPRWHGGSRYLLVLKNLRYPRKAPGNLVDQLRLFTGESFERFLRLLFARMGFVVEETPLHDQGTDLILIDANDPSQGKTAVQAKRYNQDVGNNAVQEILGGMYYCDCNRGMVVGASGFTRSAKELASKAHALLWDRPILGLLIEGYMSDVVVFVAERQPSSAS